MDADADIDMLHINVVVVVVVVVAASGWWRSDGPRVPRLQGEVHQEIPSV